MIHIFNLKAGDERSMLREEGKCLSVQMHQLLNAQQDKLARVFTWK